MHKVALSKDFAMPPDVPDDLVAVNIITRKTWDALPPRARVLKPLGVPVRYIWFSSTGESTRFCNNLMDCTAAVQNMQITHMDELGLADIKNSFLIGGDGRVYEGRGWAHPPEKDLIDIPQSIYTGLNIAFIGDQKRDKLPTDIQMKAVENFINNAMACNFISKYYVFNPRECKAQLIKKVCLY